MISVLKAKSCVLSSVPAPKISKFTLDKVNSHVLAESIIAPIDLPNFDNSAMDGYGISFSDLEQNDSLFYKSKEVKAGDASPEMIGHNEACLILTGAMIPEGVDTVVPIENVKVEKDCIHLTNYPVVKGQHIRRRGEQIRKGDVALEKGTQLSPAAIGFLAALGIREISVFKKPKVAVITTGNELVELGTSLKDGQIYNSNKHSLLALLNDSGICEVSTFHCVDRYESTYDCFQEAIANNDLVISTGGVSVGKYDLVDQVLSDLRVEKIFHKVNQKPGKPIFFGKKDEKIIFGLPGNPAAVVTSFYQYVLPCIKKWQGFANVHLKQRKVQLTTHCKANSNRTQFLKARYKEDKVDILKGQGSHILQTMAQANCLVELPPKETTFQKGDVVIAHILPNA